MNFYFQGFKLGKYSSLSIVIPCFNEAEVLPEAISRLSKVSKQLERDENLRVELIFIDDGSLDSTYEMLLKYMKDSQYIKVIHLSRNFGHQIAITAGMDAASGDAIVVIDVDLQDPPEKIIEMTHLWRQGYEVVYGTRLTRIGESTFKLMTAKLFYRFLNALSDVHIPPDTGDFRLISREVLEVLQAMPERYRYIRGMVSWVGFKQVALLYNRDKRYAGESKYPLLKMLSFAADGLLSFSTKPLLIATTLGLTVALLAIMGICYVIFLRVFTDIWAPGWTTQMFSILFIGGVQLVFIGILGQYVGRIYNEVKRRPLYIVAKKHGVE
jgi:glycosyltransferase involved in cell wall biosynthesis